MGEIETTIAFPSDKPGAPPTQKPNEIETTIAFPSDEEITTTMADSTDTEESTSSSTTTTPFPFEIPPAPPTQPPMTTSEEEGDNTAVTAGASAVAVGAAVLVALKVKGVLSFSKPQLESGIGGVEVEPGLPEREQMVEIDYDMYV